MLVCSICGSTNPVAAPSCSVCGGALAGSASTSAPAVAPAAKRTLLGLPNNPAVTQAGVAPQGQLERGPSSPVVVRRSDPDGKPMNLGGTQVLPPSTESAAPNPNLNQTIVQYPKGGQKPAEPNDAMSKPDQGLAKRTMLGIAPLSAPTPGGQPSVPETPPAAAGGGRPSPSVVSEKKTMLGVAMPGIAPSELSRGNVEPAVARPTGGDSPASRSVASHKQTMLGVAIPGIAPIHPGQPPASKSALAGPSTKQTVLGVAVPGIAPLHAGNPAAPPAEAAQSAAAGQPPFASPPQPPSTALPASNVDPYSAYPAPSQLPPTQRSNDGMAPGGSIAPPRKKGVSPFAWFALGLAALLLAVGTGLALTLTTSSKLSVRLVSNAEGTEQLELLCDDCPNDTQVNLDGQLAKFSSGKALVNAPTLSVGSHKLAFYLTRPGQGAERVDIEVPINYRIETDLAGLDESPPKLRLKLSAREGTRIKVEGESVAISSGSGVWERDLTETLSDPSAPRLEQTISYELTTDEKQPHTGTTKVSLPVTKLFVEAPLASVVTESSRFLLAGTSQRGAKLRVGGNDLAANTDGSFSQQMTVSKEGETTIILRASAPDHAPRLAPIRVKRVSRLADEAADRLRSITGYDSLKVLKDGGVANVEGKIVEARVTGRRSIVLLDVTSSCKASPCFARVIHAGRVDQKAGALLQVFGVKSGNVEGARAGAKVPEIHAEFLREGK